MNIAWIGRVRDRQAGRQTGVIYLHGTGGCHANRIKSFDLMCFSDYQ
jgi:hypothetical protein